MPVCYEGRPKSSFRSSLGFVYWLSFAWMNYCFKIFCFTFRKQPAYRRIFVYTFCLINICLSLSDDANKIKTLNIEGALPFQLSLKIWARYAEWFWRNSLLKTRNYTENVWLINFFATQQFRSSKTLNHSNKPVRTGGRILSRLWSVKISNTKYN